MQRPNASNLSQPTYNLLDSMLGSGDAQQVYVASALDEIASNGGGQEEDSFLLTCAQELMASAAFAEEQLRQIVLNAGGLCDTEDSVDPETLSDLLLLVDIPHIPLETITGWCATHQYAAEAWATAAYLQASDNDVEVPECPHVVPPDNAFIKDVDFLKMRRPTDHIWDLRVRDMRVAQVRLPEYVKRELARRYAYWKFKDQLQDHDEWDMEYVQ